MKTKQVITAALIITTGILSGCASTGLQQSTPVYSSPSSQQSTVYGVVDSIQVSQVNEGSTGGTGAVVGGLLGGLLGNQVGSGSGRTAATVAGAVGGAVVGNQVEKGRNTQTRQVYQVGVRLDDGGYQTVVQDSIGDLRAGNRVRIQNNHVYRN